MIAIILDKPVVKLLDSRVDGGKGFLLIFGYLVIVSNKDGYNDNIFVEVNPTKDGIVPLYYRYHHFNKKE